MIVVFGTVCVDRMRRVPSLPQQGGYVSITEETDHLGGEAANTTHALLTWGAEVETFTNGIGDGYRADRLANLLRDHGLPESIARRSTTPTPMCDIYLTPDGDRTMFGIGFSEMADSIDPTALPLREGAWFTADMNFGDVGRICIERAADTDMRLYLMDVERPADLFSRSSHPGYWQSSTDWFGVRGNTQKNVTWVQKQVDAWGATVILSDGPNGLVAGSPNRRAQGYPPFPCPALVDSTGAGDMFRAGMLFGLDQGWRFEKCLAFASAAGCLKCQYVGATDRVPTDTEIRAHLKTNPQIAAQYGL
ncbi:MAG: carbohydrate kinase family protein [Methanoregulaceae archaeon]|nr:carbohydrate kinase family protein [Methanoregulaceae archaeon]